MLFKLSIKNIKQSLKDYGIYFFTLVFAVAMFYMFNSIDAQSSMLKLNSSKQEIVQMLVEMIGYVSIFVSIILGFLIIYSNNFLIKKRKKEIGLYFTLGMSKRKVSVILLFETLLVGLISLVIGLLFGVFLSQFFSVFTAKLFEVDMNNLSFIFSRTALNKAILYFGLIFILVMIFNVFTLNRYKLIDLINANKKNEQIKMKNKYLIIITFILSVLFLGYAYYLLLNKALLSMDYKATLMIICGAIGTFLLFYSLSGFLLKVIEKMKKVYYKDLNLFTLKQVNNKINTTVFSTTIICLMLLLTIGILSGSMSLAKVFNSDFSGNNLSDYTISTYSENEYSNENIHIEKNATINKFKNIVNDEEFLKYSTDFALVYNYYDKNLIVKDMLTQKSIDKLVKKYGSNVSFDFTVPIITESDYNNLLKVQGKDAIDIKDNEYILTANIDFIIDAYMDHYENGDDITINNIKLVPATKKILKTAITNNASAGNDGCIVVSDNVIKGLEFSKLQIIGNFIDENVENSKSLYNHLSNEYNAFSYSTRMELEATSVGLKATIIFLGLYLGITFAISSATILAIGQLSESSDNKSRYKILRQLGADNKVINKALFRQIAIIFVFPLVVALIHSYFGLREINGLIISVGNIDLTSNIILTTLFMVVVYGGYFLLTYICSKNIIKD